MLAGGSTLQVKINLALLEITPAISELKNNLENGTGLKIELFITSEQSLFSALKLYKNLPHLRQREKSVEITEEELIEKKKSKLFNFIINGN